MKDTVLEDTIKEVIKAKRQTLASICERAELLNRTIPKLKREIEIEEVRLGKIVADNKPARGG
ncbi:unnamed protein product [marine sediment metagenome]|uniref:Uncharacterized protein n=1 Tax=marine sediment metagenome TaxID=412755 RepID=X1BLI0_9ZZZZ